MINEEADFHNKLFKEKQYSLKPRNKAYAVVDNAFDFYRDQILESNPKTLLELASSTGLWSSYFQDQGMQVFCIDLSFEAAKLCSQRNQNLKVMVGDILLLPLNLDNFDCVIGSGIIHHVDSDTLFDNLKSSEVQRGMFIEPLAHNPLINLYRFLTPNSRTKGERPLLMSQIKGIQSRFPGSTFKYFGLISLLLAPFTTVPFIKPMIRIFQVIDQFLLNKVPILQKYAWIVVMNLQKGSQERSK